MRAAPAGVPLAVPRGRAELERGRRAGQAAGRVPHARAGHREQVPALGRCGRCRRRRAAHEASGRGWQADDRAWRARGAQK